MNLLVTAGNTMATIDRVRGLTNIFTGRTGARIAQAAHEAGHRVTLMTSQRDLSGPGEVIPYRTFEELHALLREQISTSSYDAIVHSAAISDYLCAGVYAPDTNTHFDAESRTWSPHARLIERGAGKIKSDAKELWLRMRPAPKLIDCMRRDWGFAGVLVKFKLEVGVDEATLLSIAERSRLASDADLMVANTLDEATAWAYLGPLHASYEKVARSDLPQRLLSAIETLLARR